MPHPSSVPVPSQTPLLRVQPGGALPYRATREPWRGGGEGGGRKEGRGWTGESATLRGSLSSHATASAPSRPAKRRQPGFYLTPRVCALKEAHSAPGGRRAKEPRPGPPRLPSPPLPQSVTPCSSPPGSRRLLRRPKEEDCSSPGRRRPRFPRRRSAQLVNRSPPPSR